MTQTEYHLRFPRFKNQIEDNDVTFAVANMKCGNPQGFAVVYFILHAYDVHSNELHSVGNKPVYTSKRWVVDNTYSAYQETFHISDALLDDFAFIMLEMVCIGVDDDNPLYFTNCMLTDEPYTAYHAPNEAKEKATINLVNTCYAELYNNRFDGFLQVIRPSKKAFTTEKITANDITVLAPHLNNEEEVDKPINIVMEFLNQRETKTNISMENLM